jgi:peroxiredoxin
MKTMKLIYLILALMLVVAGCKKKEPEPAQQTTQTEIEAVEEPKTPDVAVEKALPETAGNAAPSFTLQDLSGKQVSLSDFRGKVVVLDFWATWCPPCVMEIPHFIELYEQYEAQGFAMVGISLDRDGIGVVEAFASKYKINYPILMNDGRADKDYGGITSIPTTFVIDRAGNIRQKYVGYREKDVFEADIKALLVEPGA